jgi:hypothetical protein
MTESHTAPAGIDLDKLWSKAEKGQYITRAEQFALISLARRAAEAAPAKDTPESMAESNARFAIDGAIQYGRENRNAPPSADHWLYEYWNIGQQLRELGKTGWDNVTPLAQQSSHSTAAVVAAERPDGAIHNAAAYANQLENIYDFECEAGPLRNCYEWIELRRCLNVLADYANGSPPAPMCHAGLSQFANGEDAGQPAPTDEKVAEACFAVTPDDFKEPDGWVDYLRYDGAVVRAFLAANPVAVAPSDATGKSVSIDVQVFAIDVEKRLCAALGRQWSPAGISIDSLIDDLKRKPDATGKAEAKLCYCTGGPNNHQSGCTEGFPSDLPDYDTATGKADAANAGREPYRMLLAALDAYLYANDYGGLEVGKHQSDEVMQAIEAARAALSAPPVAWMNPDESCAMDAFIWSRDPQSPRYRVPVYDDQSPATSAADAKDAEPKPLAHGHREDWYLLANARRVAEKPIHAIRTMPNWVLASELFATGCTAAHQICRDAGIDPDGYQVQRAAMAASRKDHGDAK